MSAKKKKVYGRDKWSNSNQVGARLSAEDYGFLKGIQEEYGLSQSEALKFCIREAQAQYNTKPKGTRTDGEN